MAKCGQHGQVDRTLELSRIRYDLRSLLGRRATSVNPRGLVAENRIAPAGEAGSEGNDNLAQGEKMRSCFRCVPALGRRVARQ